ncbi:MAG: DapH/DapD/GlmU-related protein [Steroidobacteraceae bacterium]
MSHHRGRWRAFRRFGVVLPPGAVITHADAIRIGARFGISSGCRLICQDPDKGSRLTIGDDVLLNTGVLINADCGGRISIGNKVLLGPNVVIRAAGHRFDDKQQPILTQGHEAGSIDIGDDVWIGANAVILPNVRIGSGCVVGAGSVVTRDLPDHAVAMGVPARVSKIRGSDEPISV